MAKLYIVGTPIGNLGDISPRAARVLSEVDFIAAEDTRVSAKLLNHLDIKKPMISYHQYSDDSKAGQIAGRIAAGESCAVITDAGMPCISDPGEELVMLCHDMGLEIESVPGPTAAMTALAASGLPTGRFAFEGFLTVNKKGRLDRLAEVKGDRRTLIFYEAPHKLRATLADMLAAFGDRRITLCREMTKLHEEFQRTTLSAAVAEYTGREPKGEYVLIVEGAPEPKPGDAISPEEAVKLVRSLAAGGLSLSDAAKQVAKDTGYKKGELYRMALS